jgi:sugar/nucleoside kinase (ribokinase family)
MLNLISIGDVTEDVFVEVDDAASLHCEHHRCFLDFPFGAKLGIRHINKSVGGNAGNVAVGCQRLGLSSAIYTEVGDDTPSEQIFRSLKEDHVSTKYFFRRKGEKTNYSVVLSYHGERTILVHHEPRRYHFPRLKPANYLYLTSLAEGGHKLFPSIISYLKKNGSLLAFNPGTYQLHLGLKKLSPVLRHTHIIFLNLEEAQSLLGIKERNLPLLLSKLNQFGPEMVVITDSQNGSYCLFGNQFLFCPIYHVPVVEKTGAGDAFSSGFLASLSYGNSPAEALRWGSLNSASVIQKVGPQDGLLKLPQLNNLLKVNPSFRPRKFHSKEVLNNNVYYPKR